MTYISYGVFSDKKNKNRRLGAKLDDLVFDLRVLAQLGILDNSLFAVFNTDSLNQFIAEPDGRRKSIKSKLLEFLTNRQLNYKDHIIAYALDEVDLHLPIKVAGFTDFYASISHATNIGKLFRPDNPLMPNWKHLPVAYNGRASSIVVSNHSLIRPRGQILDLTTNLPQYKECQKLDFEVELGVVIGKHNHIGHPIKINDAKDYIFGVCILNDWSARDIQSWEYQPLGPFNSKGFLTSISPWIIPIDELDAFKVPLPKQDPKPLKYLCDDNDYLYDINFEVILKTKGYPQGMLISKTNFNTMYWSINQWIAHHTVSGTSLNIGDILGSGTISGFNPDSYGSLMELTKNGKEPIQLPNGESRAFLQDGDELTIHAYCGKELDLGSVTTKIVPSFLEGN